MTPFQTRVQAWILECFGPEGAADEHERCSRLLEEVLELMQAMDFPRQDVEALTGYVYARPVGDPALELGGVMVTLAGFCNAVGLDMAIAGDMELARISTPEKIERVREKSATKPKGSALPGRSLPNVPHLRAVADAWEKATGDATIDFSADLVYVNRAALEKILGTEPIPDGGFPFKVNGKEWASPRSLISYEDVVALAYDRPLPGCTVTFPKGAPLKPSGHLMPGQAVPVVAGMHFSAAFTGNA